MEEQNPFSLPPTTIVTTPVNDDFTPLDHHLQSFPHFQDLQSMISLLDKRAAGGDDDDGNFIHPPLCAKTTLYYRYTVCGHDHTRLHM